MEINDKEALYIIHAIQTAEMELGDSPEGDAIIRRILEAFPSVDKFLKGRGLRDHLWSVEVELDPRVIEARHKMESSGETFGSVSLEEDTKPMDDYFKIKEHVFEELKKKHGLI